MATDAAVWLGLGLTVAAVLLYLQGASIKWLAVTPRKWSGLPETLADLRSNAPRYLALFVMWAVRARSGAAFRNSWWASCSPR